MKKKYILINLLLLLLASFFLPQQVLAGAIFATIEGTGQGLISDGASSQASIGNLSSAGHEDEITVLAFTHNVVIPLDPQGQQAGSRQHQPITIFKYTDKSSPLLFIALTNGEHLATVEFKFYRTSPDGSQEHYYTIALADAIIVAIQTSGSASSTALMKESVSFVYRAITWTHVISGTEGQDDWREPI